MFLVSSHADCFLCFWKGLRDKCLLNFCLCPNIMNINKYKCISASMSPFYNSYCIWTVSGFWQKLVHLKGRTLFLEVHVYVDLKGSFYALPSEAKSCSKRCLSDSFFCSWSCMVSIWEDIPKPSALSVSTEAPPTCCSHLMFTRGSQ